MGETAAPRLDVAIVSYRSPELLRRCLRSLEDHPPRGGARVVVVDNASGDGTEEMVREEFPGVELLVNRHNLGFAAASNLAIRSGRAPYVLALNPDAAVHEGTLDILCELCDSHPEIGCCGPRLVREDGSFDHAARRSFPTPLSAFGQFTGIGARLGRGPLAAYRAPEVRRGPIDAVNGAFMLLRRRALEEVGLFDEGYWMYMEDLDLCWRLARAGWLTWYESEAAATHTKAGTTGGHRGPRLTVAFHRGMGRFYRKHYAPNRPAAVNLAVYAGIGVKLGISLATGALRRGRR